MNEYRYTIVGPRGLVGQELLRLLHEALFDPSQIRLIDRNDPLSFTLQDIVFLCLPTEQVPEMVKKILPTKARVIDLSACYRLKPDIPLVIPEINAHLLEGRPPLISSPNCTATLLLMALYPIHKAFCVNWVQTSSYQAASGAGHKGLSELLEDAPPSVFPHRYQHNVFLHESTRAEDGYCTEEMRVIQESQKILEYPELPINIRCVRVPVVRTHALSVTICLKHPACVADLIHILEDFPGIQVQDDVSAQCAVQNKNVLIGNVRATKGFTNTFDLWVVGDQLCKGAAQNALQIAQIVSQDSVAQANCK